MIALCPVRGRLLLVAMTWRGGRPVHPCLDLPVFRGNLLPCLSPHPVPHSATVLASSDQILAVRCRRGWKRRLVQPWQRLLNDHGKWRLPTWRLRQRTTGWLGLAEVRPWPRLTRVDVRRRATWTTTDRHTAWWRPRSAQSSFNSC